MRTITKQFFSDSLYKNSFFLVLSTAVLSGFGFFFWLISARLINPEHIGIASTLIASMNFIAMFSLLGVDSGLVRFLANSRDRNEKLNTGIMLVAIAGTIFATVFILLLPYISPTLAHTIGDWDEQLAFVIFCVASGINMLTDSVFLAYRATKYSFIVNGIFSFIKMLLPLVLYVYGAIGIFASVAIAQTIGALLSLFIIWKVFDYRPRFVLKKTVLLEIWRYSAGTYTAVVLSLLPVTLLPLIITNTLGSSSAAFFYIVLMIANLLYAIPKAVSGALFAEGSFDEANIGSSIKKALKAIFILIVPAIFLLCILAEWILSFFGASYALGGLSVLYLFALSGVFVSVLAIFTSIYKLRLHLKQLIATNMMYAILVLSLSLLWVEHGLLGIGFAWFVGNALSALFAVLAYVFFPATKKS